MTLLTRDAFKASVFARDKHCVICKAPAVDAHHIVERSLWEDDGYYLENGVALCSQHHIKAEQTVISCSELRESAGIKTVILPEHFEAGINYDKWGNIILPHKVRIRGEAWWDSNVQKVLKEGGVLGDFLPLMKYPKTMHLPFSPGLTNDDRVIKSLEYLEGHEVIITEKKDGENTGMLRDHIHARSLDSKNHPSRNWVKALHGQIAHEIPEDFIIFGENVFAQHSIAYNNLKTYFFVFSIWERGVVLSWDETEAYANMLGLHTVPVLWRGIWNEAAVKELADNLDHTTQEGIVVRRADRIRAGEWKRKVAKWVRPNHVQTDEFWMTKPVVPNKLSTEK